jgi:hypothetical protein
MKNHRLLIATIAILGLVVGWAAFRPELLFINRTVNESLPGVSAAAKSDAPVALSEGNFRGIAHETRGTASILRLADGKNILRLTDVKTSNGPDVHVYLVGAKDAADNAAVQNAGYIDLGSIKGNEGDQNYDVPVNTDLNKYQAVTIWCARFHVNFATAPLAKKQG